MNAGYRSHRLIEIPDDHLPFRRETFDVVGPVLQHVSPLIAVLRSVIDPAHTTDRMVQSLFDNIGREALLVQVRRTCSAQVVNCERLHLEADALQRLTLSM